MSVARHDCLSSVAPWGYQARCPVESGLSSSPIPIEPAAVRLTRRLPVYDEAAGQPDGDHQVLFQAIPNTSLKKPTRCFQTR